MSETYIWVPCRTQYLPDLARGIFDLHRPPAVRAANEVTEFYGGGWIDHPSSGYSAWAIPAHETINVAHDPDGTRLGQVLSVFVQDQSITLAELQGIVAATQSMAGQVAEVASMIPPSWAPRIMRSRADLVAAGYLEAEE